MIANGLAGQPLPAADSDSDAEGDDGDGTDDESTSDQSTSDSDAGGYEYGSSSGSGSDDEWQEVDDAGDVPEAAAPQAPQHAGGPQQQGAGGPQQQAMQQQAGPAQPSARLPPMMEPHLHFLAGLKGLGECPTELLQQNFTAVRSLSLFHSQPKIERGLLQHRQGQ